jgi:hypothetical protein
MRAKEGIGRGKGELEGVILEDSRMWVEDGEEESVVLNKFRSFTCVEAGTWRACLKWCSCPACLSLFSAHVNF